MTGGAGTLSGFRRSFSNLLWLWTLLVVPLSLKFPGIFLPLKPAIKPLLGSVILAMGLTLSPSDFKFVLKKPGLIGIGILSQYSFMPVLGLFCGLLMLRVLPSDVVAGQVLTGSCPTGVVSNVYNFIAGANVALSISLSGVNTFISPILTPILVKLLAGRIVNVDLLRLFSDMFRVTLVPLVLGVTVNALYRTKVEKLKPFLPAYSTVAVVMIVGFVVASGRGRILSLTPISVSAMVLASLLHLILGYVAGYAFSKRAGLGERDAITISIETAMQNSGLATVLSLSQWGPVAALPAITYSVVQNVVGPFVCSLFRKRL